MAKVTQDRRNVIITGFNHQDLHHSTLCLRYKLPLTETSRVNQIIEHLLKKEKGVTGIVIAIEEEAPRTDN